MVLAAQRSYPASLAGRWEFPGGKVEDGEEPEDALRREIREELGIGIAIGRRLRSARGDWRLPNGMDMRLWLARPMGEPQCGHHLHAGRRGATGACAGSGSTNSATSTGWTATSRS